MKDLAAFSLSETALPWQNSLASSLWSHVADLDSNSDLTGALNAIRSTASQGSYRSRLSSRLEAEVESNPTTRSDSSSQSSQFLDMSGVFGKGVSETTINSHQLLRQPVVPGLTATSNLGNKAGTANDSLTGTAEGAPLVGAQAINTKINFQPDDAFVPKGYIKDAGKAYNTARGFGWVKQGTHTSLDVTANARDRNQPGADQRLDTLIHMQGNDISNFTNVKIPAAWEYKLPNGTYNVTVNIGDQPNARGEYDSQHTINVEGVSAIDGFQGSPTQKYKNTTVQAKVEDGKLTIDAVGGTNTKINYIHIVDTPAATPPNVVVIMADDLSRGELGKAVDMGWMPNFKTYLLDQGTSFRRSFVSNSLCCPSRATFLTGQYSHNHGVLDVVLPKGGVTKFNDTSTLATWLKQAGYQTGLVGKYLNEYGKDLVAGDPSDDPTYIPPGWDDWQALVGTPSRLYNYVINDNGTVVDYGVDPATPPEEYQTDVLARRSVRFINESEASDDTTPFFLSINPSAPHLPATPAPRHQGTASTIPLPQPPSFNELDVSDKPAWLQTTRPQLGSQRIAGLQSEYRSKLEALRAVDDLVGKVVTALVQNKELKNTVLMFTSDNGYMFGDHRLTSKVRVYEESIRVPLYIRAPGISKQSTSRLVINNDLAPTIADFANATPDIPVDGRSLIPLLQEPNLANWRKRFLVESFVGSNSGRDYFAVRTGDTDTVTPKQVYVEYAAGDRELYDLAIDPYQLQSLHKDPARQPQIQILQNHLANLKTSSGESSRIFEDAQ